MIARLAALSESQLHRIQQVIKWVVYTLLIINFIFYIFEDWNRARLTLDASATFLDWTAEFATSIDESGWFLLLFMFELETYAIEDSEFDGWIAYTVHGVRIFCYLMITHTVYAFAVTVMSLQPTVPVDGDLCELANRDVSYTYNLEYTQISEDNCSELSGSTEFYWLGDDPIVTDRSGLELERRLAWVDLAEVIAWLLIMFAIEITVRMQERGITGGRLLTTIRTTEALSYLSLVGMGIYWASLSHWLYFWDELLWIGGFAAIEMNVSEWRNDILEDKEAR